MVSKKERPNSLLSKIHIEKKKENDLDISAKPDYSDPQQNIPDSENTSSNEKVTGKKRIMNKSFFFSRLLLIFSLVILIVSLVLLGYKIWSRTIGFPQYLEPNTQMYNLIDPIEKNLTLREIFYDEHTQYEIQSTNNDVLSDNINPLADTQGTIEENENIAEDVNEQLQPASITTDSLEDYYRIAPIQIRQANRFLTLSGYQYPDLSQYSAISIIAVNLDTGEVLFSKEADKVWPIASITKMISALVILDKWSPDDEIIASGDDYVQIERHVGLREGETFSVKEGLEMMIMYSYNDVPVAFARAYDGGYPAFVNAMNQKAKELGMDSSHFEVVEGLSGDNVSTANDLISLTREFLENDLCREISSTKNQSVSLVDSSGNSRNIEFANTNQLIFSVPENVGIKTGFLYVSGENFVSLFNYDNLGTKNEIVIVVLGSSDRFGETNSLFQSIKNY